MHIWLYKIFFVLLLLWCISTTVNGQHKSWRQYTTDDGLPGNEVFDIIQDQKGYLWFATNQGICRFNGYEFVQPVDTSVFAGSEAFVPIEDSEGRIWFARLDGSLWTIVNDTVRAWHYNFIIDIYRGKFNVIDQLGIDENGVIWLAFQGLGLLVVQPDGTHQIMRGTDRQNFLFTKVAKKIVFAYRTPKNYYQGDTIDIISWQDGQYKKHDQYTWQYSSDHRSGAWEMQNGEILLFYNATYKLNSGQQIYGNFLKDFVAEKIIQTNKGDILLASHDEPGRGLLHFRSFENFQRGNGSNLLAQYYVTDVLCDREGGWWAATRNGGVLYCKNPAIDIYDTRSGLSHSNISALAYDGKQHIYVGQRSREIYKINTIVEVITKTPPSKLPGGETATLFYDTLNQRLWNSSPNLKYLDNNGWHDFLTSTGPYRNKIPAKKITADPSGRHLWISASIGFYKIDFPSFVVTFFSNRDTLLTADRTFSVTSDLDGKVWIATINGLRIWENNQYTFPPFEHPALRFQARDTELLPDGSIAFGFRGAGVLIRTPDDKLTSITTREGLSTDLVNKIYTSSSGDLYACTNFGLNRLIKNKDQSWEVVTISSKQGLPSNLVNDVIVIGDEIWVATSKGLARIRERFSVFPVAKPVLEKFSINNRDTLYSPDIKLSHQQNNITIKFYSLHFRSEGDLLYRYRLSGSDTTFNYSKNRQVNFPNLTPGKYHFEVQAQNENGEWSELAKWSFEIMPPWWRTWWFLSFILITFFAGIIIFYKNRIKGIRHNNEVNNKIKDLEMAALRAQMNPHFIFNCLGSIQQFIAENDSASATRYLSRFAKLVRLSLHSSVDGKHSLSEEIEMLDNYLALEQMRFKGKFKYEISKDSIINPDDIYLPPMLIQPFVENALKHGMKNNAKEGLIKIDFEQMDRTLHVTVTDNGPGFSTKHLEDGKEHKSFGMKLTRKRLDIISGNSDANNFTMENIMDVSNQIQGTRVVVHIPVD